MVQLPRLLSLAVTVVLASGCATTLSSFQTAKPLPRGRFQVHAGAGIYAPLGQLVNAVTVGLEEQDRAREAGRNGEPYEVDEARARDLLTAGIALGAFPPAVGYEFAFRAGVLEENLDVGVRYSGNSIRGDVKFRLFHRTGSERNPEAVSSFDVALGAAYSNYLFSGPAFKVLEFLKLDDFSRQDLEIPVYVSYEIGHFLKLYAVPKWVWSNTRFDGSLVALSDDVTFRTGLDVKLPERVHSHFFGATTGIGLGYRYVHVFLELTSGYTTATPRLFGEARQLGGVTLYPAIGLVVNFGQEGGASGGGRQ